MSADADRRHGAGVELVYLTAPDCHLCERGRRVLDALADDHAISVRELDLHTDEGRELAAAARVPFPPAVFVGGRLLAHGRLSARALARQLASIGETGASGRTPHTREA